MTAVTFAVAGHPITQGSKTGYVINGRAVLVEARGHNLIEWRRLIADEARRQAPPTWPLTGPVHLELRFWLVRPKSHPKTRRTWPTGRPDVSKLTRAAEDALAGVAWLNDAQVVHLTATKDWTPAGHPPGVTITVQPVGADQ